MGNSFIRTVLLSEIGSVLSHPTTRSTSAIGLVDQAVSTVIQTLTEPNDWRFIPGRLNQADAATRSKLEEEEIPSCWLDGLAFLNEEESVWPTDLPWMAAKEELRSVHVHFSLTAVQPSRAKEWQYVRISAQDLPALIRLEGEFLDLVKRSQQEAYPEELKRLQQEKMLRPTSQLLFLTPFLDEAGILRLCGKLSRAKFPYDVLHPPILLARIRLRDSSSVHSMRVCTTSVLILYWLILPMDERWSSEFVMSAWLVVAFALRQLYMADVHRARLDAGLPPFHLHIS
jgi:hypothetical protein